MLLLQLTKYQEQPQLLDGHLEGIVQPLAVLLRSTALSSTAQDTGSVQDICRLLHVLISVRGYKTVVRFFPHEASDLERVLQVGLMQKLLLQLFDRLRVKHVLVMCFVFLMREQQLVVCCLAGACSTLSFVSSAACRLAAHTSLKSFTLHACRCLDMLQMRVLQQALLQTTAA
jgi:hypothetical protein